MQLSGAFAHKKTRRVGYKNNIMDSGDGVSCALPQMETNRNMGYAHVIRTWPKKGSVWGTKGKKKSELKLELVNDKPSGEKYFQTASLHQQ